MQRINNKNYIKEIKQLLKSNNLFVECLNKEDYKKIKSYNKKKEDRSSFSTLFFIFLSKSYSVGLFFKSLLAVIARPCPTSCSIIARTFNGKPKRVINPCASL